MVASRVSLGLLGLFVAVLAAGEVRAASVDVSGGFTTTLEVAADGSYEFSLLGDEGSTRVLIDGHVVIDESAESGTTFLTQGIHSLEVQFDDCCGGIQLVLPDNVAMQPVPVPEPHTLLLLGAGLAVLAVAARMRTRSGAPPVGQTVHRS
jgi:hypothetical protein